MKCFYSFMTVTSSARNNKSTHCRRRTMRVHCHVRQRQYYRLEAKIQRQVQDAHNGCQVSLSYENSNKNHSIITDSTNLANSLSESIPPIPESPKRLPEDTSANEPIASPQEKTPKTTSKESSPTIETGTAADEEQSTDEDVSSISDESHRTPTEAQHVPTRSPPPQLSNAEIEGACEHLLLSLLGEEIRDLLSLVYYEEHHAQRNSAEVLERGNLERILAIASGAADGERSPRAVATNKTVDVLDEYRLQRSLESDELERHFLTTSPDDELEEQAERAALESSEQLRRSLSVPPATLVPDRLQQVKGTIEKASKQLLADAKLVEDILDDAQYYPPMPATLVIANVEKSARAAVDAYQLLLWHNCCDALRRLCRADTESRLQYSLSLRVMKDERAPVPTTSRLMECATSQVLKLHPTLVHDNQIVMTPPTGSFQLLFNFHHCHSRRYRSSCTTRRPQSIKHGAERTSALGATDTRLP